MQTLIRSISLFSAILVISACSLKQERENLKNCIFDVESLQIEKISFPQVELTMNLSVENPNADRVVIDKLDFSTYASGKKLADGNTTVTTVIPAGMTKIVPLKLKASILELGSGLFASMQAGRAAYRVEGTAYVDTWIGTVPVPFSVEQQQE